jgi:N-acetylglucosamine-6-phosphate deacetylase
MSSTKTYLGRSLNNQCVKVTVTGKKITGVESIACSPGLPWILPPLVDLQHNGFLKSHYNALHAEGADALYKIAGCLRKHGVGRCLATITTYPYDKLIKTSKTFNNALSSDDDLSTLYFGMFHEGVFISPQNGWRGAHYKIDIKPPDWDKFCELDNASGNRVKVINIAPEEPGGLDFIEKAVATGKKIALGHCCPDAQIIKEAVKRGATMVTHFGNGAAPQIHRFKNPFWAMLDEPDLKLGLICDGYHLPKELIGTALKCKGLENCYPVSDASVYSGLAAGNYKLPNGTDIDIEPDGYMHLHNEEILFGAWFQQDHNVEFLVRELGFSLVDAWRQCSIVPANIIGIKLPELACGEEASFVLAAWNDGLVLEQCIHNGLEYL